MKPKISLLPKVNIGDPVDIVLNDFKLNYSDNSRELHVFTGVVTIDGEY